MAPAPVPVVLLNDLMDSTIGETEIFCFSKTEKQTSNSQLFDMEQTEPLNLCLNGAILKHSSRSECGSKDEGSEDLSEQSDDDVIFVTTYKTNRQKLAKRPYSPKISSNGQPRRNPIRKARDVKRFKEYTDVDFLDNDFLNESEDERKVEDVPETCITRNEDSEDWRIEDIPKKPRQRRRVFSRKVTLKVGRKRKVNRINTEEKKVPLADLAPLIEENLLLLKDYIDDVRTVRTLLPEKRLEDQDATANALNIFKQQVILLSVVKGTNPDDLPELISEWIAS